MGFSLNSASKSVGKFFNNISGATSAAEQSYAYNKEFAQNAHQWEVADMEKAGLNPILSADGSGATGNVSPVSGGAQMATGLLNSILDFSIMGKQNDIAQQDVDAKTALATAETEKTKAEAFEKIMQNKYLPQKIKQDLAEQAARTMLLGKQAITEKLNWGMMEADFETKKAELTNTLYKNLKNESENEFLQTYGVTKDQAIEIYKSTGIIIGNFINKPTNETPITSANKQDKKEPHFDKKGKK